MKQEYTKPSLEVLGELRDVTTASPGGPVSDLVQGRMHWKDKSKKPRDDEGSS